MAKRKASKAKASRPAKRAKASGRTRPPVDPVTGNGLLFDPVTGEPTQKWKSRTLSPEEHAKRERDERERAEAIRVRRAARKAAYAARLSQRPPEMRSREFGLPDDVRRWLVTRMERVAHELCNGHDAERCFRDPWGRWSFGRDRDDALELENHEGVRLACTLAFVQGCMEGYIEGCVAELVVRRKASDNLHRLKRAQEVSGEMDMDERDAAIFAEVQSLAPELGKEAAERRLAGEHGISDRQVRNIVLEQTVLPEYLLLVPMLGEEQASLRVLDKYGVDKHGKANERKRAAIQKILPRLRLRKLPETP